jgi:hypothetical protein
MVCTEPLDEARAQYGATRGKAEKGNRLGYAEFANL